MSVTTGSFSHRVWSALVKTSVGETLSYGELASRAGRPKAARAVGRAMRDHSIPILIPCHRVLTCDRKGIGNYSGGEGASTKAWLLKHEQGMASSLIDAAPPACSDD